MQAAQKTNSGRHDQRSEHTGRQQYYEQTSYEAVTTLHFAAAAVAQWKENHRRLYSVLVCVYTSARMQANNEPIPNREHNEFRMKRRQLLDYE